MDKTTYDVFKGIPGTTKNPVWLGAIAGLNRATEHMNRMAERMPGDYFVSDSRTGEVVASVEWESNGITVAIADCPSCGQETVVGRVESARNGFHETTEVTINCKRCNYTSTVWKSLLYVRSEPRKRIDAEYGVNTLPWL